MTHRFYNKKPLEHKRGGMREYEDFPYGSRCDMCLGVLDTGGRCNNINCKNGPSIQRFACHEEPSPPGVNPAEEALKIIQSGRVEFRVREVTRYIVTRHDERTADAQGKLGTSPSSTREMGEFDNYNIAFDVAQALARAETTYRGVPIDHDSVIYPKHKSVENAVPDTPVGNPDDAKVSEGYKVYVGMHKQSWMKFGVWAPSLLRAKQMLFDEYGSAICDVHEASPAECEGLKEAGRFPAP